MRSTPSLPRLLSALVLLAGLVVWTGCDSSGLQSEARGQFVVHLTDAPADLQEAVVTVDRVDLVPEDAEEDADEADDEGIITLSDQTRQINLLNLQGGVTETLADVTVPEGTYTQLRLILGDDNYVVLEDGSEQDLTVPSGQQTGIKIILPEVEIEDDGDQVEVTLDFDVEESFIQTGNGQYLLRPTVKVKSISVNGTAVETVGVEGAVTQAGSDAVEVEGIPFTVTPRTEFDGDNGVSGLADLEVGQYVEVEGTLHEDETLEAREVDVEDDDEIERSITARIASKGEETLTLLGVTIEVTPETEFDEEGGLDALAVGDRVEVEYEMQDGVRVATEVEWEDD